VRELAMQAGVNPNTMQRALAQMEEQGLLYTQRTAGRFVTEDVSVIRQARQRLAVQQAEQFLEVSHERAPLVGAGCWLPGDGV
jgi:DNA-binding transcriptional regulator YhcF (GntR family)